MRATVTPSPRRKGKRRLLTSCAITAGMVALAYGGPALAQVAGTGNVVGGSATISPPGPGPTNVNTTSAQTIINWTPSDTAATGGDIDFLPTGNTWNFNGNGNYIVLNRFVNGAGGSLSRQIALNGTVNSTNSAASGAQGGSIWFYNAGGILIGSTGAINVGSLVLTTNDIDTTGGLLDPASGAIRFRGTSGSTSTVTVAGSIDANQALAPGSSYVALVAPRVVQAGSVSVYGSAAYVAAEQADITINGGLFDINVLVGAEGGNVITHTGSTAGPEQQATGPAQRIYMVAIPKNVAVGMLVSGQVGYQDGATTAITNSDGSVVLSAGYNITNGLINTTPANNVGADITVNDIIFRSNVLAHASGAFLGQPLLTVPAIGGPVTALPPPQNGRFIVQGNGTFIGDTSSTLTVNANRVAGATGTLTLISGGRGGVGGSANVNVNGGTLQAIGGLSIIADAAADPTLGLGTGRGGTANLSVTNGGVALTNNLLLSAVGTGGITDSGTGGTGTGGTASVTVSGTGSMLSATSVSIDASGFGGGLTTASSGATTAVDEGGDGQGGNALLTVDGGGSLSSTNGVALNAGGFGELGNAQSGNGTGGTARLTIGGDTSSVTTPFAVINAIGVGGGSFSRSPIGTFFSTNGGDGRGGTAELLITSASTTLDLGGVGLDVSGYGGGAGGNSENTAAGDAFGGNANVAVNGNTNIVLDNLSVNAHAEGGSATSASGQTARSGNAQGGNIDIRATGSSTLTVTDGASLDASGNALPGENVGDGAGGNIAVTAMNSGTLDFGAGLQANAFGGITSGSLPRTAGSATGGNIDLLADLSGTITASNYNLNARAAAANAATSNGTAQGGRITMTALNGGLVEATSDGVDNFDVSAQTGYSQTGASATGGEIDIFANEASIALSNVSISAGGVAGGALAPGAERVAGTGGNVVIRTGFGSDSTMGFGTLYVDANGRTQAFTEGTGGEEFEPSGDGQGGTVTIQANGADLTISGSTTLQADGYGGLGGASATGRGGIVSFTQIGGNVQTGDLRLSADGYGGLIEGQSGDGIGGDASATFTSGNFNGGDLRVSASGFGGAAFSGDDLDSANPRAAGNGGNGQGGNASITIAGDAVVNASVLAATASGFGAAGGDFYNYNGAPGAGGNGGNGRGGFAAINLTSGELNADAVVADAGGTGGNGGSTILTSTSSGFSTGFGVGGNGGNGEGGSAMIELAGSSLNISESVTSYSGARGGDGGGIPTSSSSGIPTGASVGGNGGSATGGLAQVIVDNYDAGVLSLVLDTSSFGGNGGDGTDGNAGNGGNARGGSARVEAIGPNASVIVSQANFEVSAAGGNGGSAYTDFFSRPTVGGRGGNGGDGVGGDIQIVATDGATVGLGIGQTGGGLFGSTGTGGNGGRGADNPGTITLPGPDGIPGTPDDVIQGLQGGDGGIGGGGTGGTVFLFANGGTITSGGAPVGITVNGVSGQGGDGGVGSGGTGSCCSAFLDFGGRVLFETRNTAGGAGQITLGDTVINANGGGAGRIEMRSAGNITMASLTAEALGFAFPTNNDTDEAGQGIFFAPTGGTISTAGDLTLRTGGSIGVYAQGSGRVNAGGNMSLDAGDQIDLRHTVRGDAANATLFATGDLTITAGNTLTGATGTLLGADGTLTLANSTPNGSITVDRLDGDDIVITSDGAVSVEHAEAVGDFTATAGSFRTGLNSIITGGNIDITSAGAVDLGNSTAGGYVDVDGQSITFANIVSGFYVDLNATGTASGAEGINGGTITSDSSVFLNGNSIMIDSIDSGGSLSANASGGNVAIDEGIARGGIGIFAQGDITGSYAGGADIYLSAGGDIIASASAIGEGGSSSSGTPIAAGLYVDADGDVMLSNSEASGMFGVNAGGSATISGGTAGEDMLVLAGTTANLSDITVGDDLNIRAPGAITVAGASATGDGPDGLELRYSNGSFTIGQGEGNSTLDGADINIISANGSINASGLSAGDDIFLSAATIALNGATTLGLGTTGGDSSISTTGGDTDVSGLDAFDDILINSTGTASISSTITAGRNVSIEANDVTLAGIILPNNQVVDTVTAGGNINVTSANDITGGAFTAGGSLTLTADGAIGITQAISGEDAEMTLTGATGISANILRSRGITTLTSDAGAVQINSLSSRDAVTVSADSLNIGTNGPVEFANIITDVGDATIQANNRLIIDAGNIAGTVRLSDTGEHIIINSLTAANVAIDANEMLSMTNVTATGNLDAEAGTTIFIDGTVTGQNVSLASADIDLVATGRVGTAGVTQALSVQNNDNQSQTYVGGTGTRNGFHIDAAELTRLYGNAIEIFAPEVQIIQPASVGSSSPPDVIVDTFTMTGGGPNAQGVPSNLGANGALTIRTTGKMRVIGNVQLTGLTDTNALNLIADDALEVILGQGTVRLLGANNAPGGVLNMESDDIIVATSQAINDVGNATTMDAINTRLGQNDGVTLDEGALFARRIAFDVVGGVYVQNSGTGTDFGQRRGLTFGAGGLDVTTEGSSRIVLNGVHLGPNGQVTGLDVIPLLTLAGGSVPTGGTTGSLGFDPQSTLNGCFIANTGACTTPTVVIDRMFPVQDVIEDEDGDGDEGDGTSLPTALITMRDLDPLSGEPLLDDPVTGAGNDDLWTPTTDTQQP